MPQACAGPVERVIFPCAALYHVADLERRNNDDIELTHKKRGGLAVDLVVGILGVGKKERIYQKKEFMYKRAYKQHIKNANLQFSPTVPCADTGGSNRNCVN